MFDEPRYVDAAARAATHLLDKMRPDGRLARSAKDGRVGAAGFLDDYAFACAGLIDLFEATFEPRWLREAITLAGEAERLFADPAGGWFMTAADHEKLIAREKPAYDGAEPSGTSVALLNALRLATFTSDDRWRTIADRAFSAIAPTLIENPLALTEALLALDYASDEAKEIAIVWPRDAGPDAARPLLDVVRRHVRPQPRARRRLGGRRARPRHADSIHRRQDRRRRARHRLRLRARPLRAARPRTRRALRAAHAAAALPARVIVSAA